MSTSAFATRNLLLLLVVVVVDIVSSSRTNRRVLLLLLWYLLGPTQVNSLDESIAMGLHGWTTVLEEGTSGQSNPPVTADATTRKTFQNVQMGQNEMDGLGGKSVHVDKDVVDGRSGEGLYYATVVFREEQEQHTPPLYFVSDKIKIWSVSLSYSQEAWVDGRWSMLCVCHPFEFEYFGGTRFSVLQ
jgi:hypothetical protein